MRRTSLYISLSIIAIGLIIWHFLIAIPIKIDYDLRAIDNRWIDKVSSDDFTLHLTKGFTNDKVKVILNDSVIFSDKITTDKSSDLASEFKFKKQKKNRIQFIINIRKTQIFYVDTKYNHAICQKSELNVKVTYLNFRPIFD